MDKYEQALVDFARRWRQFGGPSAADVFVEFGITLGEYRKRLADLDSTSWTISANRSETRPDNNTPS